MEKAISFGNKRRLDGRVIVVKHASYGRSFDRGVMESVKHARFEENTKIISKAAAKMGKAVEGRSFKEALLGSAKNLLNVIEADSQSELDGERSQRYKAVDIDSDKSGAVLNKPKVVNYVYNSSSEEVNWLRFCAIGRLCDATIPRTLQEELRNLDICCTVSYLGGISVLLMFKSFEEMVETLEIYKDRLKSFFDEISPWDCSTNQKKIAFWVKMADVPLQCWHYNFFKSLGDNWGSFIKLDSDTAAMKRFDVARMLVSVESLSNIPSYVAIIHRGRSYKILVEINDTQFSLVKGEEGPEDLSDACSDSDCTDCMNGGRPSKLSGEQLSPQCSNEAWLFTSRDQQCSHDRFYELSLEELVGCAGTESSAHVYECHWADDAVVGCAEACLDEQLGGINPCFGVSGTEMVLWRPNISTERQQDIGGPPGFDSLFSSHENREGQQQNKCTCMGPCCCISHNNGSLVVDLSAYGHISHGPLKKNNVLCDDGVFETEKFVPTSVESSDIPFSGIISEGKLVVDLSVFGHLLNLANENSSSGAESSDDFGSEAGGSLEPASCGSEAEEDGDFSEIDSVDREAEETWNISQALGLRFKGCKEVVIETFKNYEKEDRKSFGRKG
ncbi:hypothetical protein REPUB_Repub11eG0176000 [Reevesia pubescens]